MRSARGPIDVAHRHFVFFGAPGVGKGTFASHVGPILGIPAISTGDIVRHEIKAGTELGKLVKVIEYILFLYHAHHDL